MSPDLCMRSGVGRISFGNNAGCTDHGAFKMVQVEIFKLPVESLFIALLLLDQDNEAELPCWPYKLSKRLDGAAKLQDVWV
jgi:hypothetical protein